MFGISRRVVIMVFAIAGAACSGGTAGIQNETGGSPGSGGISASGGTGGSGGMTSTGGVTSAGGQTTIASGGSVGGGGSSATGGAPATGGQPASGGSNGTGGRTGSGGRSGTGGDSGMGGSADGGPGGGSAGATSAGGSTAGGRGGAVGGMAGAGGSSAVGGTSAGAGGTAGGGGTYVGTKTPGTAQTGDITVNPGKTYQVVDGFGEADVWQGSSSTAMQTLLWDPVNGIGLTLLRIGIESVSGKSVLMGNAGIADGQACVKFNGSACKVWAAPWSPPASMKNNNNVNGGASNNTLKTDSYDAWATLLAAFPAYYKQQGGPDLYAISAQNEPDWNPSYEACIYDKTQMVTFINALGPKLAALNPPVLVLAPEPDNWGNLWSGDSYGPAIIADANANKYVGPIATHDYGNTSAGTYARPAPPANNTHHVWETECTPGDKGPITIATMVYAAFTTGGVNGWHYWWTQDFVPSTSSPPAQYYALGNYSKFVRPGFYRADVTGAAKPSGSVPLVSAFTNLSDGTVAIVVVNGGSAAQISLFVAGTAWPASVTPYVTTSSSKLAAGSAITVSAGRFSASLEAQSVTTFVGKP
jgi:glucuronoarabinoxylan endo-1,4-beta-xylanase